MRPNIVISIVSHGQGSLVRSLLEDLSRVRKFWSVIVVTVNIEECLGFLSDFSGMNIVVLQNMVPAGFGRNHNAAFVAAGDCDYFLVVNPDIRLSDLACELLLKPFVNPSVGISAPCVLSPAGSLEDSARKFPTIGRIFARVVLRRRVADYSLFVEQPVLVDWVAGMFVIFRSDVFRKLRGFDERYFMYFEDVDICRRAASLGYSVAVQPNCTVVHDARRASRTSLRHFLWHIRSAVRFFFHF